MGEGNAGRRSESCGCRSTGCRDKKCGWGGMLGAEVKAVDGRGVLGAEVTAVDEGGLGVKVRAVDS